MNRLLAIFRRKPNIKGDDYSLAGHANITVTQGDRDAVSVTHYRSSSVLGDGERAHIAIEVGNTKVHLFPRMGDPKATELLAALGAPVERLL